jgi:hypothetical protein
MEPQPRHRTVLQLYTPPQILSGRLYTIGRGYPQTDASYPHFYVDAGALPAPAELLLAFLALVVLKVERVDKLSEG